MDFTDLEESPLHGSYAERSSDINFTVRLTVARSRHGCKIINDEFQTISQKPLCAVSVGSFTCDEELTKAFARRPFQSLSRNPVMRIGEMNYLTMPSESQCSLQCKLI